MIAQIVTTIAGFFVLVVVLRKFFWGAVLQLLDERRRRIESGFQQIARGKADLERLQQELTQRLAKIDEEARTKIQQAVLEGKRIAVQVQEDARAHAREIVAKSKDTIELELAKAKVTLRDAMADMTIEAVECLLKQKLDAKTDEQVVASILEELEQAGPS